MAKAKNPETFSSHFRISAKKLHELGVLDVTLAIDTKLFIDPFLLKGSSHKEINTSAYDKYILFFNKIFSLLKASKEKGDAAWKGAQNALSFHEVKGTCLGYGAASIKGSGFGKALSGRLLKVAKEMVDIGSDNPDLFLAMALIESDIGADRISDMVTNIIIDALIQFNQRILSNFEIEKSEFLISGKSCQLLKNPFEEKETPVILVPTDILRKLPIAGDWDSISDVAWKNQELRDKVNALISEIWVNKANRDLVKVKSQILASVFSREVFLDVIKEVALSPYDSVADPDGLIRWANLAADLSKKFPIAFQKTHISNANQLVMFVKEIIGHFTHLVENCGINKEFFIEKGKVRNENSIQKFFFAISYSFCKANNVDVSPEIDTGNGKIDFKFSKSFELKVLVEVKLSTNTRLVDGYIKQLDAYRIAQETDRAIYLVIDVGQMGRKDKQLLAARDKRVNNGEQISELIFVDAKLKLVPSKM